MECWVCVYGDSIHPTHAATSLGLSTELYRLRWADDRGRILQRILGVAMYCRGRGRRESNGLRNVNSIEM